MPEKPLIARVAVSKPDTLASRTTCPSIAHEQQAKTTGLLLDHKNFGWDETCILVHHFESPQIPCKRPTAAQPLSDSIESVHVAEPLFAAQLDTSSGWGATVGRFHFKDLCGGTRGRAQFAQLSSRGVCPITEPIGKAAIISTRSSDQFRHVEERTTNAPVSAITPRRLDSKTGDIAPESFLPAVLSTPSTSKKMSRNGCTGAERR